MNADCASEPASFLRLERYLLGELAGQERARIVAHLGECATCRACLDELRAGEVKLPELQLTAAQASGLPLPELLPKAGGFEYGVVRRLSFVGGALALAAAVLLMLRNGGGEHALPMPSTSVKGGDVALPLVRERGGDIARDPSTFDQGDRLEANVSCPPSSTATYWDLVVLQAGETYFPLRNDAAISCGNHVALPGTFRLTGKTPATVCVVLGARALDRVELANGRDHLPPRTACAVLVPAQR